MKKRQRQDDDEVDDFDNNNTKKKSGAGGDDDDNDGVIDDVFAFPTDNEVDAKAAAEIKKQNAKKKSGGFQSLNLIPPVCVSVWSRFARFR